MEEQVKAVLDTLRPYLQMDGGDLEFVELTEDKVVRVKLKGACAGCPGAVYTLKMGIERKVREEVPDVVRVEAVPF
ncbi:MAG: NifU family protein [Deltaproteobacteria bacterium]|nr:NifU family protein [Deltaproteobacteria bacterium]